ncbi:MAG: excinuclease ABC subunit A, partial [Bacteroidota bacterium]|nr:excinuclease ABC subunit A [Bacteroidota bacterium]
PEAGTFGGEIMYSGVMPPPENIDTLTTSYLRGERKIEVPKQRRKKMSRIDVKGASHFNLKNIDVSIPLHQLVAITGVSGSGKSTLIKRILYPALVREIDGFGEKPGSFSSLSGDISSIKRVEMIDQQPLGKSSRSNPVTYIKAYDAIRTLYSKLPKAQAEGYKPKAFSFNVDGGRCDECKGDGFQIVEMQFLADVRLECESCKGQRFKDEILEITYKGKSIYDVLSMTVDEAMAFFTSNAEIRNRLKPLQDVGLGYVQLGQSSSTLSGGEAQRVKLASFLVKGQEKDPILFFFDEPTTGLHFHDVAKLLAAFEALIEKGHSVVVIEHNLDIIKSSDYLIELGPVGGDDGGYLMYQGNPEGIEKVKESPTRPHLLAKLGL